MTELEPIDDDSAIRTLVARLARPHPSGGDVIERAAIVASGADSAAILKWIATHAGVPENLVSKQVGHGLYGGRGQDTAEADLRAPLRYVLPAGALATAVEESPA